MKYLKIYEDFNDYIYLDSIDKKSPEGYKFQIGNYVKYNGNLHKAWWNSEPKFDNDSLCIICVVNKKTEPFDKNYRNPIYPYAIVPIKAPNSSYEIWVNEEDLRLATDAEIALEKYNL